MEIGSERVLDESVLDKPIRESRGGATANIPAAVAATPVVGVSHVKLVLRTAGVVDGGDDAVDLGESADS